MCRLKSARGFSLVEVLVSVGVISLLSVGTVSLSVMYAKDSKNLRYARVAMQGRAAIEAALKKPSSWANTLSKNANMSCLLKPPGCALNNANNGFYDFLIYNDQNQKVSYDGNDGTSRIDHRGNPCAAGEPNPSPNCPFKFSAQWRPICNVYPCANPTLDIQVNLSLDLDPGSAPVINPLNYSYSMIRGIEENVVETACRMLDGVYNVSNNTCRPKYAGKSCLNTGFPYQVATGIKTDGSIECGPLYQGQCVPSEEYVSGITASGQATCSPLNCNCLYSWSACSQACGGGTQFINILSPPTGTGSSCPASPQGCNTQACSSDCVGAWGPCSASCGGGTQSYSVYQAAVSGGLACAFNDGDTRACNIQACPVDCQGSFGDCDSGTGLRTYTITQAPANGGLACPFNNGDTVACPVNCAGSFGACSKACGGGSQVYAINIPDLNGGLVCPFNSGDTQLCNAASCGTCGWLSQQVFLGAGYPHDAAKCNNAGGAEVMIACNGATDGQLVQCCNSAIAGSTGTDCVQYKCTPCVADIDCVGSWSACVGPTRTYTITQAQSGNGANCPFPNGYTESTTCPVNCVGDWTPCNNNSQTYVVSQPAANGGLACPANDGDIQACGLKACYQVAGPLQWWFNGQPNCLGGSEARTPLLGQYWETAASCWSAIQATPGVCTGQHSVADCALTMVPDSTNCAGPGTVGLQASNSCNYVGNYAWGGGCSDNVNLYLQNGQSYTVTSSATGFSGTTVLQCTNGVLSPGATSCTNISVNGACGAANGTTVATAPNTNLCNAGNPSALTDIGTGWNWSCTGTNGGTNASCSATSSAGGLCWSMDESFATEWDPQRCSSGNVGACATLGQWKSGGKCANRATNIMEYVAGSVNTLHSECRPSSEGKCNGSSGVPTVLNTANVWLLWGPGIDLVNCCITGIRPNGLCFGNSQQVYRYCIDAAGNKTQTLVDNTFSCFDNEPNGIQRLSDGSCVAH